MEQTLNQSELKSAPGRAAVAKFDVGRADLAALRDLIAVLAPQPKGLRKWSVMRAIRARRDNDGRDIPLKFENDVERAFRRFCAGDSIQGGVPRAAALFYRPKDTAGEVWAVDAEMAQAWLDAEPFDAD